MPLTTEQKKIYDSLNTRNIDGQIEGLKHSIYFAIKEYLNRMGTQYKVSLETEYPITSSSAMEVEGLLNVTAEEANRNKIRIEKADPWKDFLIWGKFLNAGQYALSTYRGELSKPTFLDDQVWMYSAFTKEQREKNEDIKVPDGLEDYLSKFLEPKPRKANRGLELTFPGCTGLVAKMKIHEVAALIIGSYLRKGVWVTTGHHMTSVNGIMGKMTLFDYRLKECWFQEAGKRKIKEVGRAERNDKNKFSKFEEYGIQRSFYHHLRMINYPKEIKTKNRMMTGFGTDIIDYIEFFQSPAGKLTNEDQLIMRSMKAKTRFWKETGIIDDVCQVLKKFEENKASALEMIPLLMTLVNMRQPTIEYRFIMPAFAYTLINTNSIPDFSAQGAYKLYVKLQNHLVSNEMSIKTSDTADNMNYAVLISAFDLLQADQRMVLEMFGQVTKQRKDFAARPNGPNAPLIRVKLPQLIKWSKAYKGERGMGGTEQAGVMHTMAGSVTYRRSDFEIGDFSLLLENRFQTGRAANVSSILKQELYNLTTKGGNTIKFGTQGFHLATDLEKTNEELGEGATLNFAAAGAVPFYGSGIERRGAKRTLEMTF